MNMITIKHFMALLRYDSDPNILIHPNDPNMTNIIYPELSYKLTGLCFQVQKELGRFCREKQYADRLDKLLQEKKIAYQREVEISKLQKGSPEGNRVDFVIDEKIIVDIKAKRFVTKEDYYQMQRYLQSSDLELGMIINFRNAYLKPKRVLNSTYSGYSDAHSGHSDRSKGYIALITVLVTGAVGAAITVSLILLGLGSSRTSFSLEQSNQAKALANACAEEALQQIRDSTAFTGTGSLTLGQGTCGYTVVNDGGENRTVTASATVGTVVRKIKIIVNAINPAINITSWQEVAD